MAPPTTTTTPTANQVPTRSSANPITTANALAIVQTASIPVTVLTISNGMFSTLTNNTKFSNLCLSKDNWPKWSQKIIEVIEMSELDEYLSGTVPIPDASVDAVSFRNWKGNNKKLIGFLKVYVDDGEKTFLVTDNAHIAWTNLRDHHEKQVPIMQVCLIQELLSIYYPKDISTWAITTDRVRGCILVLLKSHLRANWPNPNNIGLGGSCVRWMKTEYFILAVAVPSSV
jgi:hypothetical protein